MYHQIVEEADIIFCTGDTNVTFVACLAEVFHLNQFTENIRRIRTEVFSSSLEPFAKILSRWFSLTSICCNKFSCDLLATLPS